MHSIDFIKNIVFWHAEWVYLLLFLGVIVEGEIAVILAGIFSHLGSINICVSFLIVFLGGVVKSVIGYSFGFYLQKNHSHSSLLCKIEHRINKFLPHFEDKPFWSMFFSRFLIFGLYWFTLIFSGYKRVDIKTFIKAEISSLITWTIFMLSLGYFFSYTALAVSRDIRNFVGLIILFFIGFFVLEKILSFFVKLFETDRM